MTECAKTQIRLTRLKGSVKHCFNVIGQAFHMSRVKRICVFEHSIMTNFNCACPAIQWGRGLAFYLKVPFDSLLVWASSEGSGETARMRRLAWTFAARIGYKYQIRLTRSICLPWLITIKWHYFLLCILNTLISFLCSVITRCLVLPKVALHVIQIRVNI